MWIIKLRLIFQEKKKKNWNLSFKYLHQTSLWLAKQVSVEYISLNSESFVLCWSSYWIVLHKETQKQAINVVSCEIRLQLKWISPGQIALL